MPERAGMSELKVAFVHSTTVGEGYHVLLGGELLAHQCRKPGTAPGPYSLFGFSPGKSSSAAVGSAL